MTQPPHIKQRNGLRRASFTVIPAHNQYAHPVTIDCLDYLRLTGESFKQTGFDMPGESLQRSLRCIATAVFITLLSISAVQAAVTDISSAPMIQGARGKVVLLDFWASWCTPCRKSFPWMNALQKKYGDRGLTVIAVNMDKQKQLAAEFLQTTPAQFQIEYDPQGELATRLDVSAMPTSFLLDRNGRIVKQHAGFRDAQRAARELEIEQLLKE